MQQTDIIEDALQAAQELDLLCSTYDSWNDEAPPSIAPRIVELRKSLHYLWSQLTPEGFEEYSARYRQLREQAPPGEKDNSTMKVESNSTGIKVELTSHDLEVLIAAGLQVMLHAKGHMPIESVEAKVDLDLEEIPGTENYDRPRMAMACTGAIVTFRPRQVSE
jgi:hypothetical protein